MSNPSTLAKRKQLLLAFGVLTVIGLLAVVGVSLTEEATPAATVTRPVDIKTKSYIAPGEKIDPEKAWRGVADSRLTGIEDKMSTLENENKTLKRQLEQANSGQATRGHAPSSQPPSEDDLDAKLRDFEQRTSTYPDGTPSRPALTPITRPTTTTAQPPHNAKPASTTVVARAGSIATASTQPNTGMVTIRLRPAAEPALTPSESSAGQAPGSLKQQKKTTSNYLPSGMFGQAVVLSGLDAPTGGQSQTNPHPVLLQLRDLSVLPNRYRYDWKECLVTAAGYGDISSERAYIRTESLSCVGKNGEVLDVPIKGYIAGEDGKAGMRGRLVSKQGQALANALLAGVVSGIGTGIQTSSSIQSTSALGTTSSIKPGSEFQAGIGAGVGKALDKLAEYYIKLAEKMFPVIEVDAGRVVDIVLTKGVTVDVELESE